MAAWPDAQTFQHSSMITTCPSPNAHLVMPRGVQGPPTFEILEAKDAPDAF
jgi:hypothetical protein